MSWKKTIRLKHLLSNATNSEAIKNLANGALEALKNEPTAPKTYFQKALDKADSEPDIALMIVNTAMIELYDWADDNRIWIG